MCDQGKWNVGAISLLNNEIKIYNIQNNIEYKDDFYEVTQENGERTKIVHLFYIPHLMKCTRNNLIIKDLSYKMNDLKWLAKWQHLVQLYSTDSLPDSKMLPKLTGNHVIPEKIHKIKVRYATQVFSQRVSAVMKFLVRKLVIYVMSCTVNIYQFYYYFVLAKIIIEPNGVDTAIIFLFFDKLFDSAFIKLLKEKFTVLQ